MFKTPKTKDVTNVVTNIAALKIGGMASRGVAYGTQDVVKDSTTRKVIVGILGLGLAMSYKGPRKSDVQALGAGMALEQLGTLVDEQLQEQLPAGADDSKIESTLRATYGLKGSCGCNDNAMMLNAAIPPMVWENTSIPQRTEAAYTAYEEVTTPAGV